MPALSGTEEPIVGLTALVGLVVATMHLVVGAVLVVAARRLGRRLGGRWRLAIWPPLAALPLPGCGLALTIVLLVRAFHAIGEVDPVQRSTVLAGGISESIHAMPFALLLAWALYAATAVALAIGHLRRARE